LEDLTSPEKQILISDTDGSYAPSDERLQYDVSFFVKELNEIIFILDERQNIVAMSDMARDVFGVSGADGPEQSVGRYLPKVYIDAISQRTKADDYRKKQLSFPARDSGGHEILLETRFNWFRHNGGKLLVLVCRNVDDYMRMLSDLRMSEDRYRTIFWESPIGFIHVNSDAYIIDCNNAFLKIFGLEKFEVSGVCLGEENNLDIYPLFKQAALNAVVGTESRHESEFVSNNGKNKGWVRVSFRPVISENRSFLGAVGIVEDITEAKAAADKITFVSSHDPLTGLLNRRSFEEAQHSKDRDEYLPLGVIYADLNCLKLANDAFGHHEGDILLKTAADILRGSAGANGEAFRLGGDEFILFLTNTSAQEIADCVEKIAAACVDLKYVDFLVEPSMALGNSIKISSEQKIEDVVKKAEDTMYANKIRLGKSTRMKILGSLEERLHRMDGGSLGRRAARMLRWGEWLLGNTDIACERDVFLTLCRYHDLGLSAHPEEISLIGKDPREENAASNMRHMAAGYRIAKCTAEIAVAAETILSHHERWDGKGYPNQLREEEIPAASRMASVFDTLESLISLDSGPRMPFPRAWAAITGCAGKQFDPRLINALSLMIEEKPPKFLNDPEC
jgi:diguanylate cyclase (GGDEF)-like protein/PAS domain S-box-containing protein